LGAVAAPAIAEFVIARIAFATSRGALAAAEKGGTEGLRRTMQGSINTIRNVIKNNGTFRDFLGAARESRGVQTGFDHVTEMRNSVSALERASNSLQGSLNNPNLAPGMRSTLEGWTKAARTTIDAMKEALK
jgi:hypothetical protein